MFFCNWVTRHTAQDIAACGSQGSKFMGMAKAQKLWVVTFDFLESHAMKRMACHLAMKSKGNIEQEPGTRLDAWIQVI